MNPRLLVWLFVSGVACASCFGYGQLVDSFDVASYWRVILPGIIGLLGLLMVLLSPTIQNARQVIFFLGIPALLLRLALFPAAVSDDVNRYLWEGQLVAEGISPYLHTADAEEWAHLRDGYWESMNHKDKQTAYPPLSELAFGAIAWVSYHPMTFKVAFTLADLLTLAAVLAILFRRGLNPAYAGFYAFNPLVLLSFAAEAHFDAMMLAPLVWSVWLHETGRSRWAVALASIASGIKWVTLPLVPFFAGRKLVSGALVSVAVLLLPALFFWESLPALISGLLHFGGTRSFNGPVFDLLYLGLGLSRPISTGIVGTAFLGVLAWRWFSREGASVDVHLRWVLGALVVLSPTVHFWYLAWLMPFVALRPSLAWMTFSLTGGLYFFVWTNDYWGLLFWQQLVFWGPFFLCLAYELWTTRSRAVFGAAREESGEVTVGIVIPTLNAATELPRALASVQSQKVTVAEVVISDAGSTDATREVADASELPTRVIDSGQGRGQQIAAGIEAAKAEWVVVLHADCVLPVGALPKLKAAAMSYPRMLGGAFGQRFENSSIELLPIELLNDVRALFTRTAFGDQVQFFHRASAVKHSLVPKQPLMEDVESSWRLRETGEFVFLGAPCFSSRQKWSRQGWGKRLSLVFGLVARYLWARKSGRERAEQLTQELYEEYYGGKK